MHEERAMIMKDIKWRVESEDKNLLSQHVKFFFYNGWIATFFIVKQFFSCIYVSRIKSFRKKTLSSPFMRTSEVGCEKCILMMMQFPFFHLVSFVQHAKWENALLLGGGRENYIWRDVNEWMS